MRVPFDYIRYQVEDFFHSKYAEGVLLFACVLVALVWANSPAQESYHQLWDYLLTIQVGGFVIQQSLHHWVNDGLMAVFFFKVGLEIKEEFIAGELSSFKKAILPIACAAGGMLMPALFYTLLNFGGVGSHGWGIPMATDIAFTLGILTLLSRKVPFTLKIFITALAVVDDLGSVLVIALFYTDQIVFSSLLLGLSFAGILFLGNRLGIRNTWFYGIIGVLGVWQGFLWSGVHATIAGVLGAMAIPVKKRIDEDQYLTELSNLRDQFDVSCRTGSPLITNEQLALVQRIREISTAVQPPLQKIDHLLSPVVSFFILPVFALANAGITIGGNFGELVFNPISFGVIVGLVLGKFIGVVGTAHFMVWRKWATLPRGVQWRHLYGAGFLTGIGFTMSLFIAELAFVEEELIQQAKVGILLASSLAILIGLLVFWIWVPEKRRY